MKFILAGLILMIPMAFLLGYFAGSMQDFLYERENDEPGNLEIPWGKDYDR